ncbi:MAG: PhoX family phosphatase [Pseudomonadota bacterium]|nr:PhoX family phosphatase [Pseudomonadota bacterium]MDP2353798.1 PhoX family phosphatase [Pseudomonadota bacterium]
MSNSLTKHHPLSPNGVDDEIRNPSDNIPFEQILQARLSRRAALKGGFGLAASSFMGLGLGGCLNDSSADAAAPATPAFSLGFNAVAKSLADVVSVPAGYSVNVLYRLGDPINGSVVDYRNDGSDSADSFASRAGDHHDGMHYFGLNSAGTAADYGNAKRGLLVLNHENITQIFLHTNAEVAVGMPTSGRVAAQIDKEVNAHGISVIEVVRDGGPFQVNKGSRFNRRLTAASLMDLSGPARGDALMATRFSPGGTQTRGTLNNCANGYTPWGTYLTCEENWAGYFKRPVSTALSVKEKVAQERNIGASASNGSYGWANPTVPDTSGSDPYARWDITLTGATARDDFRNAANTQGWVVEIDPYSPTSVPRKRTAMGRFAHEGAMPAKVVAGRPLVYYMGDDARTEYMYKYVSNQNWVAADAATGGLVIGDKYLDDGKLYVAKYNADGSGQWIELNIANPLISGYATYDFANQADVLINSRLAADALGATPMDRPEWADVHPVTGDIYVTLTNNSNRGATGATGRPLDAANPRYYDDGEGRKGNPNGHIVRIRETGGDPVATTFAWDIYLFGAESDQFANTHINVSGLTDDNDFSSPDGLWFSQANPGLMWIQTDDSAYTDVTNCMMLAALPGRQGDGRTVSITNTAVPSNGNADQTVITYAGAAATPATLKRFLVGPKGCEITGVAETPDGRALFINIQHPGEDTSATNIANPANFQSVWPGVSGNRPRSATIVITRNDGGIVGS